MMKCKTCKARCIWAGTEKSEHEKCFVGYKPITNADRIRAMSDEEIEKWFWWMHKEMMWYTDSRVFVHDWLRQEITDMTMCETCKYENEDKNIGRCYYCRSVQDATGDWCEYEKADKEINK